MHTVQRPAHALGVGNHVQPPEHLPRSWKTQLELRAPVAVVSRPGYCLSLCSSNKGTIKTRGAFCISEKTPGIADLGYESKAV